MNSFFYEINKNIYITRSKSKSPCDMHVVHYHDCYEIIFFLSDNVSYFINDKFYSVEKHDLIFISPFDLHRVYTTGGKYYERIVLNFKKKLLDDALTNSFLVELFKPNFSKLSINNNVIHSIFNSLCYEEEINDEFSDRRINLLLEELLILLNREVKYNAVQTDNNIKDEKVSSIISFINENYMNNISLSLLSDNFYLSQSYLVHLFKSRTGSTIMEYLNKKRIAVAQQMLSSGNYKISYIGELVGFNNLTSFSRTFKAVAGISPIQYKNQHRVKGC